MSEFFNLCLGGAMSNLQIGMIVSSPEFAYGYRNKMRIFGVVTPMIVVDGITVSKVVKETVSGQERDAYEVMSGDKLPKTRLTDLGNFDETRGAARFVVEYVEESRPEPARDFTEAQPGEERVVARRLNLDGSYNREGELIQFLYQKSRGSLRPIEKIITHGMMRPTDFM